MGGEGGAPRGHPAGDGLRKGGPEGCWGAGESQRGGKKGDWEGSEGCASAGGLLAPAGVPRCG